MILKERHERLNCSQVPRCSVRSPLYEHGVESLGKVEDGTVCDLVNHFQYLNNFSDRVGCLDNAFCCSRKA